MNSAALIQFAISAVAVAAMVGLAAWATQGRPAPPLDEATARRWLADEFPGRTLDGLWLAADGKGCVARSGDRALVLTRMGLGYAARQVPWRQAAAASFRDGRLSIAFGDVAAPRAVLAMTAWPPKELAA
ncbi:hypothetical protein [Phenylobacterium sp.]|uniref:hypothetical protein n=1 Tax=Phenylobacterium sp. TaxID=1871053 RepID=UPI002BD046C7|nr:hypothetical protein [Phenylobacterium sp.]HLZ76093.1 hypothetical protein [Phenylobacterium sp.]